MTKPALVVVEGKDLIQPNAEAAGDAESEFKGREILAVLDRKDRLARDANAVGQVLLRHLSGIKAQAADAVLDVSRRGGHGSDPAPVAP